jgi:hypothetical protein
MDERERRREEGTGDDRTVLRGGKLKQRNIQGGAKVN